MRRLLVPALVAGGLLLGLAAPSSAGRYGPFQPFSGVGGGVVDLATERQLDIVDGDGRWDGAVTVLPYRPGARYRIPVVLSIAEGEDGVEVLDVRLAPGAGSAARPAGAATAPGCCVIDATAAPLTPRPVDGRTRTLMVGVDVELCCLPAAGWTERLPAYDVTYRQHGLTRTVRLPFMDIQTVVVRG